MSQPIVENANDESVDTELLGAYLLRLWLLPDPVVEAVAWQNETPPRHTTSITPLLILHAIRYLASEFPDVSNDERRRGCLDYLEGMVPADTAERWIDTYSDLQKLTAHSDLNSSKAA